MLYGLYLRMLYICCVNKTLYDIVKPNQTNESQRRKVKNNYRMVGENEDVRVLLLTSSLVNPLALVDEFSDLDIEFVLRIIQITFQTKAGRLNSEIQLL